MRPKRKSPTITRAQQRHASLTSIDPQLDLGNDLTVPDYEVEIKGAATLLADYNKQLSMTDDAAKALATAESNLADLSDRMLKGVATKFGTNSREYAKAGGTPKSEIKRGRKAKTLKVA